MMDSGIRTLGTLGTATRIALLTYVGSVLLAFVVQLGLVFLLPQMPIGNAVGYTIVIGIIGIVQLGSFVASIVLVAIWVNQAHRNLHDGGVTGLNYSPGWATASFFIPFVNLWVPFASTRELYNRSIGKAEWHAATSAGPVTSWYTCNWAAFIFLAAIITVLYLESIPGLYVIMPAFAAIGLFLLFGLFMVGSAWFMAQTVAKVTRAQTDLEHVSQADVFD
ncbi:DUF4328 domain-containing protein [Aurantiacibacter gilvus]|uniref:DUF4328 domain-containing protein n=1 Tax=Aurantiacibacter gilvus TaxID=3139141 RepID=A0ABU9IBG8_9SPHN